MCVCVYVCVYVYVSIIIATVPLEKSKRFSFAIVLLGIDFISFQKRRKITSERLSHLTILLLAAYN